MGESGFAAAIREARARGRRLVDLTVSNPTVCGFDYDADAILKPLASAGALNYDPDPRGLRSAREAVAGYYRDHGDTRSAKLFISQKVLFHRKPPPNMFDWI